MGLGQKVSVGKSQDGRRPLGGMGWPVWQVLVDPVVSMGTSRKPLLLQCAHTGDGWNTLRERSLGK